MAERVEIEISAVDKASAVIKDIGGALGGIAKIAGAGILAGVGAATAGLVGLGAIAKDFVMAASESEQVGARMEAQLAALGDAANVSADDINNLADKLSKISGFDDEDLVAAQATLLRFGNLSKEQFEKASTAATDLAAITGMDVTSAFQQLGVALDNPELGFGRLKRQIGDLTDAQKLEIKTAMEVGDVAKAQGIILDALADKTKGAAEKMGNTLQGTMNKLRVAFSNVKEDIGTVMLPYVKTAFKAFADTLITAFTKVTDFFKTVRFQDILRRITTGFVGFMATIKKIFQGDTITKIFTKIADILETKVIPSVSEFAQRVGGTLKIALRAAWDFISTYVIPVLRRLWLWLQANLPAAIKTVTDWFTGALLPALKTFGKWVAEKVGPPLKVLWAWLQEKIPQAIDTFRLWWYNTLKPAFDKVKAWVEENIVPAFTTIWNWLYTNVPDAIKEAKRWFDETLKPTFEKVKVWVDDHIVKPMGDLWDWLYVNVPIAVKEAAKWFNDTLKPALDDIWTSITEDIIPGFTDAYDWLKLKLPDGTKAWSDELGYLGETITAITDILNIFNKDADETGKKTDEIATPFSDLVDSLKAIGDKIWQSLLFINAQISLGKTLFLDNLLLIKAIFTGTWTDVLFSLQKFGEDIRIGIENIARTFLDMLGIDSSWVPETKPIGRAMIDGVLAGWQEGWDSFWEGVNQKLTEFVANIKAFFGISSPSTVFMSIGGDIIAGLIDGIKNKLIGVTQPFIDAYDRISKAVKGMSWSSIGASIINGVVSGITNTASKLIEAAKKVATDAYNAVLAALNSGSPSKLFMIAGETIPAGMAQGINKEASAVISSLESMVNSMSTVKFPTMTPALAPAMAASAVSSMLPEVPMSSKYGGGAPSIVINYSPTVSTGSRAEFEAQFVPLVDQAMRRVNRGKV